MQVNMKPTIKQITLKQITLAVALVVASGVAGLSLAQEVSLDSDKSKLSYAMGAQIGSQVKGGMAQDGVDLDVDAFAEGIKHALSETKLRLSQEELATVMQAAQKQRQEKMIMTAKETKSSGEAFLAEYAKKEGVKSTDSGIAYTVITEGAGKRPSATDTVSVHYRGTLIDGTEFDSSIARGTPAEFSLNGIIPGWQEALQMMKEGDKWEVVIPSELAYGERGASGLIGPHAVLIFEIELLAVK